MKIFTPYSVKPGKIRCPRTITDVWARAFGFLRVFAYALSAVQLNNKQTLNVQGLEHEMGSGSIPGTGVDIGKQSIREEGRVCRSCMFNS